MNRMQLMSVAFLFMGVGTLSAQTEPTKEASPWTREGYAGLKLTQVSLTNWAAGGDNSVAILICKVLIRLTIKKENIFGTIVSNWLMD